MILVTEMVSVTDVVIDKEFVCFTAKSQMWQGHRTRRRFPYSVKSHQKEEDPPKATRDTQKTKRETLFLL